MTAAYVSNLDIEKFRKIRSLMLDGATEGERNAGRLAATNMAKRVGLTLEQAVSKVDKASSQSFSAAPAGPTMGDMFRDIHRKMEDEREVKEPGYKARKLAREREKARAKAMRREELIRSLGGVAGVFALTPIEAALYKAATPFAKREQHPNWGEKAEKFAFTVELGGTGEWSDLTKRSPESLAAMREAWPFPATFAGMLAELVMWRNLREDRHLFVDGEYHHHMEVEVRIDLLEDELTMRPVASWDDLQARFDWDHFKWQSQWLDPDEHKRADQDKHDRLRQDFAILRKLYETPAQNGQNERSAPDRAHPASSRDTSSIGGSAMRRTNADKRRDVLAMLGADPDLPDREIGRRCGVSPQTVGNWRKRKSD